MACGTEEAEKIVRNTLSSLFIKETNDELKYRNKYLPDPKRLTDDKIVCTVCSISLASRVRTGKTIYIHAILGVLVCKDCHNFYGDGIFSTDEDGEDKYCRWCGQGGTLYLCSKCNCGFCKKCMTKNMKNSALAAIEDDEWKCLICVPRPIFGSRAVCWASKELNNSFRKDELLRLRLREEKDKLETERRSSRTEKRGHASEDSDSSLIYIPAKKRKTDANSNKMLNGSVKKHKRKEENSSSDSELSDDECSAKREKQKRGKHKKRQFSSSEENSTTDKRNNKKKHFKKSIRSSGKSSESDETVPKSKKKILMKQIKDSDDSSECDKTVPKSKKKNWKKLIKDSDDSSESDESVTKSKKKMKNLKKSKQDSEDLSQSDDIIYNSKSSKTKGKRVLKHKRRKKQSKRISGSSSDSSSNDSVNKRKRKNKKKVVNLLCDTSSEENYQHSDNDQKQENVQLKGFDQLSDSHTEANVSNKDINGVEEELESSVRCKLQAMTKELENEMSTEEQSFGNLELISETSPVEKPSVTSPVHVNEFEEFPTVDQPENEGFSAEQAVDEYTLSYNGSTSPNDSELPLSQEDEVKVKVHLAIEWLDGFANDIAELGCLIAEHTNKFGERKVNMESLNSYEDVLSTQRKLKLFMDGIHTNYKQIEENLEDKFKSWKLLAGLDDCGIEEQVDVVGDNEIQITSEAPVETVSGEAAGDTGTDGKVLSDESALDETVVVETNNTDMLKGDNDKTVSGVEGTGDCNETHLEDPENKDTAFEQSQNINESENKPVESENESAPNAKLLEDIVPEKDAPMIQSLENEDLDDAIIKAESKLKSGIPNFTLSGLLSSDEDTNSNINLSSEQNCNDVNALNVETDEPILEDEPSHNNENPLNEDAVNLEALQELLYSSTESEIGSTESDSDDSSDIQLDDSDLEDILKPKKYFVKKPNKQKGFKGKEESKSFGVEIDDEAKKDEDKEDEDKKYEDKKDKVEDVSEKKEAEGKIEEPLDSEAEIDMLTDLSKLKKKTVFVRVDQEESSDESSYEDSEDDGAEDPSEKKKRKKYKTECKKKREQERNELFGFLEGESSADEADITKKDLDVMEVKYASESSDSMNMETFSRKMSEKWQEMEKEQDQLNLERLLATDSEQGSNGGDDFVLDSDVDKNKKERKTKREKKKDESPENEIAETDEPVVEVKEEKDEKEDTAEPDQKKKDEPETDEDYKQFMVGITSSRSEFTGLGSSEEEDKGENEVKEEPLSDQVKKELDSDEEKDSSNSDSSGLFLDITKKKSGKKATWRQHKLLHMKLSDTDTSDEERFWQRRLEREKKKKEEEESDSSEFDKFSQALSSKKSPEHEKKKERAGSDKENKKMKKEKKKEEEEDSSSTLEMSSSDSSGSEVFKKKKRKKKDSSDSDVMIISDHDKKKKKKKKRAKLSGESSDDSEGSDGDVIDITQKSSQGESPGKGGRKNIRKVLTKHELAAATKAAAKEEEERKKRIAARQKLFNEMFEIKEAEVLEKLVLDFDPETKTELISVNKDLVTKMKPHQAKGVKFMWDSCFESLNQLKTKKGSGCILAHCMGLGKTFQVVSLVHTILTHKDTNVRTVLVVCPLSTVLNWFNEFDKWLEDVAGGRNIKIYHLTKHKKAHERSRQLSQWHRTGGVMIIGYEMFRILANPSSKKFRLSHAEVFQETLIDPGADLVVCDEGHMLKNESTLLSKAMSRIRTLRRIVLTGTPMQNNLKEYHCMVQFVKPNLLGTRKEFLNQFVNPITNGQFVDSTEADVKVMKRRAHVLHKMLEGLVQRFDYSVLTPFLPPKHEYVISLKLSDIQVKLYQFYLDYFCQRNSDDKRTSSQLFQDWQVLGRIWTHPRVLKMSYDKIEKERQESSDSEEEEKRLRAQRSIKDFLKKKEKTSPESSKQESDDEGSLKDFINDKSSSLSSSDDETGTKNYKNEKTREKVKMNDEEPKKKDVKATEIPIVNLIDGVDEINLISSEEDDCDNNDVEEVKVNQNADAGNEVENKANDSGIEDQEGKTEDKENISGETPAENNNEDGSEKENKDCEKENKDSEKENKENEKDENEEEKCEKKIKIEKELDRRGGWWKSIIEPKHLEDINQSAKLIVLFAILRECEMIEDKVLVFSQSLFSLDLIEFFLKKVDQATEENRLDETLGNNAGCWQKGLDYFRLDGSSSSENRSAWCKSFNRENNPRARLFLISTRAGGLGINLTGANRVVIFDASWNPSHDIQSIFRIYRFGQKKPCYVYRFVANGTMEEKVYDRQVAKQLLSSRVVDEQQVQRHFSMSDLNELYTFTPPQEQPDKPIPVLPKDRLMAELITQYNDWIEKYHEHDSLLENIAEEELNEEERKLAWEDYENEKKRGFITPTPGGFAGGSGITNFPAMANQMELFRKSLKLKFPDATEAEMNKMLQTLMYQVNYRPLDQQIAAQQQNTKNYPAVSQQQSNFRPVNSNNVGSSQPFTQMIQKMNQEINSFPKPFGASQPIQQRSGTSQVNQQRVGYNQPVFKPVIGNRDVKLTNRTNQEIYMEQMRKQQQANLLRIQNQKRFQEGQRSTQQPAVARTNNKPVQQPYRPTTNRPAPPLSTPSQNRYQVGNTPWKPNTPVPSRTQQAQKQRENALNILGRRQQFPSATVTTNRVQSLWEKKKQQEEMKKRISQLKQQTTNLQEKVGGSLQKITTMDEKQKKRQLEEMKKRYDATRKRPNSTVTSAPISIVEIDDEPGT